MENRIVNHKEPVVSLVERLYVDGRILRIVFVNIKLKSGSNCLCVNSGTNFMPPFGEHGQDFVVDIVVDEYNPGLGAADQLIHEFIRIINLAVEEDTLLRKRIW